MGWIRCPNGSADKLIGYLIGKTEGTREILRPKHRWIKEVTP